MWCNLNLRGNFWVFFIIFIVQLSGNVFTTFFSDALYTFYRCLYFQYSTYAHKCITGERYFVQGVKTYRNCIQMNALANIGFNSYIYWGHEKVIIWNIGVTLLLPFVLLPFNMSVSPRCLDVYQVMISSLFNANLFCQ